MTSEMPKELKTLSAGARLREDALDMVDRARAEFRDWEPEWGPCPSPLAGLDYSVVDEAVEIVEAIREDIRRFARAGIGAREAHEMGAAIEVVRALGGER